MAVNIHCKLKGCLRELALRAPGKGQQEQDHGRLGWQLPCSLLHESSGSLSAQRKLAVWRMGKRVCLIYVMNIKPTVRQIRLEELPVGAQHSSDDVVTSNDDGS